MNKIIKLFGVLAVFLAYSCSLDGDEIDPNQIQPKDADVDLVAQNVILQFATFYNSAEQNTGQLVRMYAMTGGFRYENAVPAGSTDFLWTVAYARVIVNTQFLAKLAAEKGFTTHVGIAKILEAYTYLTLVDIFNDVPRSAAINGSAGTPGFNPTTDSGESVYDYALTLLNEARTELVKTGTAAGRNLPAAIDIYYGSNRARWITLANTIELKAQMNLAMIPARKAAADARITALLGGDIIDTTAEDFTFKWGTATVPDSRHPLYNQYYGPGSGQAGGYIANHYLKEVFDGLGVQDPRWRYYFYRQVGSIVPTDPDPDFDPRALGCAPGAAPPHYIAVGAVFCVFQPGFYGRDHGDGSGTPPDGPVLTAAGVYPAGGRPDNTSTANTVYNNATVRGQGANGAGISPIWMSFFTNYVRAEFLARNGNTAGARTELGNAINASCNGVKAFADGKAQSVTVSQWSTANFPTLLTNYRNAALTAYDNAGNKLDIVGLEAWKAYWGNGLEAYNLYRRTSAPRNMQPTLQTNAGIWVRSFVYPAAHATLNINAQQKDFKVVNKVFWDTNPETLN